MGSDRIMSFMNGFCDSPIILRAFGNKLSDSMEYFLKNTPMILKTPGINFLITSIF